MHEVFISYASLDKTIAERLCGALESAGIPCWMAPRDIEPGTDYPTALVEAIHSARALLLVLTEQAVASPHIVSEVGHAFSGKKRIIPFRIWQKALPEDLEYFLSLTQWLDAPDGCTDENLKRLIEATRAALAGEYVPRPIAPPKTHARLLAVAAVVLVAFAGTILFLKSRKRPAVNIASPKTTGLTNLPVRTPQTTSGPKVWTNPADGLNYVWIPPGTFMMGCSEQDSECKDDEKPTHQVTIEKGFWLGQTEVTVAAYRKFAAQSGRDSPAGEGALPVSGVSWADAKDYCAAMGGRLPTEAEWEYAARAGSSHPYYGVISEIAWYAGNSGDAPHAVGKKQPNDFGLYDMLGNVSEWVLDRYFDRYSPDSKATGPGVQQPLSSNALAVARGGFWQSDASGLRVSHRLAQEKDGADIPIGFRCANDRP
ncbi:MAG TPA: SUMF1/EgtB/PvdO family nonheme iron enzyme [Terriglobia bacterium]|nr:SUMF1/EgtB/PvdO family nonheme iron enzyme [Terriglobia bacterium]